MLARILLLWAISLSLPLQAQMIMHRFGNMPDQYLVTFTGGPPDLSGDPGKGILQARERLQAHVEQLRKDMADTDLEVLRQLWIRNAVAVKVSRQYLPEIRALAYVQSVEADARFRIEPQGTTTQLPLSQEWVYSHLNLLDIDPLWAAGYRGQGVVVAILDSGVDLLHQDLKSRWRGGSNSWHDPFKEYARPTATLVNGVAHGTAVAGLIVGGNSTGNYLGVAPNAEWIAARIFDTNGVATVSDISDALQWLMDPDGDPTTADYPDIVSNSWGLGAPGACSVDNAGTTIDFHQELQALKTLGIDIVFAVGNAGPSANGSPTYLVPAADPNVIAVGALNQSGSSILNQSSRGSANDPGGNACYRNGSFVPFLMASGEGITSSNLTSGGVVPKNTDTFTGTSFAAPQVSGVLALLHSRFDLKNRPASPNDPLLNALSASARNMGLLPGYDPDYGFGLVQANAAAQLLANQVSARTTEVQFSTAEYVVNEGDGSLAVTVIRSGDLSKSATVLVGVQSGGTAVQGQDYQLSTADLTLNFAPNEYKKTVPVQLLDDTVAESDETFTLYLTGNANVNIGARYTKQVRIKDDDGAAAQDKVGGASLSGFMLLLLGLLGLFRARMA